MCPAGNDRKRGAEDRAEEEVEDGAQAEPAKAAKILDLAAVDTGKSSESLLNALSLIHQATKEGAAIAKARLHTVDESYFRGVKIGQDPRVVEEITTLINSTAALASLTKEIGLKVNGAPCYKLPTETMYEVFGYLDMESLAQCRDTCIRWKDLLDQEATEIQSWKDSPVTLHGTPTEIESKWNAYRTLCAAPTSMSLTIVEDPCNTGYPDHKEVEKMLTNLEPFLKGIRRFEFEKVHTFGDRELWRILLQCPQLQILYWSYRGITEEHLYYTKHSWDQKVLPLCRLEEIKFEVAGRVNIDEEMLSQLCSRLKRFYHIQGLERELFLVIMKTAQRTLEELAVVKLFRCRVHDPYGIYVPPPDPVLFMGRLKKVWIQDGNLGVLHITAPNATSLRFDDPYVIDWTLIDSCRGKLKTLHIETKGINTKRGLGQELFDMPQLEELHLNYERGPYLDYLGYGESQQGRVTDYALYSTAAFWQAVCGDDTSKIRTILPKLKKLKIVHDPLLNQTSIVQYISIRALLGQPAIEEMELYLANQFSEDTSELDALQTSMSGLHYKTFDQWKDEDTECWSRIEHLIFHDTYKALEKIDACRLTLKRLDITLHSSHSKSTHERFQVELFNFPQLEVLEMNFAYSSSSVEDHWSATALWRALSTGFTNNDGIDIKDILPRLKELTVINDGTLDQDKIINMISIRESIASAPIKSINIVLAKRFFEQDCAILDQLKETYPGFTYCCFTCWQDY